MQKLCVKWLLRLLTIDQNQQRVDDSGQCLAVFSRNKDEFFRRYLTMDIIWLLRNTPESNRQSAEWTECKAWKDTKALVLYSSITSKRARPPTTSNTWR
jgi:hypothetical protein